MEFQALSCEVPKETKILVVQHSSTFFALQVRRNFLSAQQCGLIVLMEFQALTNSKENYLRKYVQGTKSVQKLRFY